jgi:nucleoside-diphosphate-sugar epimerase
MTVLITGANGFIGSSLSEQLFNIGIPIRIAVRAITRFQNNFEAYEIGNISCETNWFSVLQNIEQVIHLAARVHIMHDKCLDPLAEFRKINVDATCNLARQAATAGVKRFIYLSSIKVNGESTKPGYPFKANQVMAPQGSYAISKYEAEIQLRQIGIETGMEIVIIRPPLVYGRMVKANFYSLMILIKRGIPLPFAGISSNRRSLVALDNLVDLIKVCLFHPAAANETFLVSDGHDLSTVDLLKQISKALGSDIRLFYVPSVLLMLLTTLLKKQDIYQRLCGSLQVDISKTQKLLGWSPPLSVEEGLRQAIGEVL